MTNPSPINCDCIVIETPCHIHRRFSPYCRMVDVSPAAPQVYFSVAPSLIHSLSTLTFSTEHVYLELWRKGCSTKLATYNAWRRDLNGAIGFYFDDTLFSQSPGYFIGDVYINCNYCFSVQLHLRPCEATVLDCYVQPALETCGKGECGLAASIGAGAIGGLICLSPSECGAVAPYFSLADTLIADTIVFNQSTSLLVAGIGPIG